MSDSFSIDVLSKGEDHLKKVFSLLDDKMITGYSIEDDTLYFFWARGGESTDFPYELNHKQAADFTIGWLNQVDYGDCPDNLFDGSIEPEGWRIFNVDMKQGWSALIGIKPEWLWYGK